MPEIQPLSQKFVLRICVFVLVVSSLAAGYYEVVNENLQGKYDHLATQLQKKQPIQLSPSPSVMETK
jgi:hypothetical protein